MTPVWPHWHPRAGSRPAVMALLRCGMALLGQDPSLCAPQQDTWARTWLAAQHTCGIKAVQLDPSHELKTPM